MDTQVYSWLSQIAKRFYHENESLGRSYNVLKVQQVSKNFTIYVGYIKTSKLQFILSDETKRLNLEGRVVKVQKVNYHILFIIYQLKNKG